jgi:prepilin peptidase CpaA
LNVNEPLLNALTQATFLTFALAAAVYDFRSYRLPNWLTLLGAVLGVGCSVALQGVPGLFHALQGATLGIGLLFLPFAARAMGAGDVKFLGALGAFLGPLGCAWALVYGAVAGGVLSAIVYYTKGPNQEGEARMKRKVPYGVALAVGGIIASQWHGLTP